jgi:hypothetical protein
VSAYNRASRKRTMNTMLLAMPIGHVQIDSRTTSQTLTAPVANPTDSSKVAGITPAAAASTSPVEARTTTTSVSC